MAAAPTATSARRSSPVADAVSNGLGWFSAALGAAEVLAPERFSRAIGIRPDDTTRRVVRAMGARELSVVPGLLDRSRPSGWLAARVAGDVLDLSLLAASLRSSRNDKGRITVAAAAVAGVTALDLVAAVATKRSGSGGSIHASRTVAINRPPNDVYSFWRKLENLPTFMAHLEDVTTTGSGRSRWTAAGPAGSSVSWEAEITDDRPGERIAWRSVEGSQIPNEGVVTFEPGPGGAGTEVRVEIDHHPPGGSLGAAVARLFGEDPGQQLADDLRRCKQVLETGQVAVSDGAPDGTRTQRQAHQEDGQPAA